MSNTLVSSMNQGKFKVTWQQKENSCINLTTSHHKHCSLNIHQSSVTQWVTSIVGAHGSPLRCNPFLVIWTKHWVFSMILQSRRSILDICDYSEWHGTWKCDHEVIWKFLCPICLPTEEALTLDVVKFWKTTDLWDIFEINGNTMSYS